MPAIGLFKMAWSGTLTAILLAFFVALPASTLAEKTDESLERKLDALLERSAGISHEQWQQELEAITADLDEHTPLATKVRAQGYLALELLRQEQHEEALETMRRLAVQAEAEGNIQALAEALAFEAQMLAGADQRDEALVLVRRLQKLLPDVASARVRYFAHNLIARLLRSISQYEEALEHFLLAHDAAQETEGERSRFRRHYLNTQIAYVQSELRHFDSALDTVKSAIVDAESLGFEKGIPELMLFRGYLESSLERHEDAIETYRQTIEKARKLDLPGVILTSMNNIGAGLMELKRYDEAKEVLERALKRAEDIDDQDTAELLKFNLAYVAIMQGEHETGVTKMEAAAEKLRELQSKSDLADLLGEMAEAYQAAGLHERAVFALLEQREISEELFEAERDRRLNELQTRYEAQEKATQIELLEQRNDLQQRTIMNKNLQQRVVILFALVVVMGLILLLLAWRAARRANRKLKQANRMLAHQSTHDPLTGLLNRRIFQERMSERRAHSGNRREQEHPDALLLLDVDHFKLINDHYGHQAGDAVLVELARRLRGVTRTSDMVVRWGGEELLLFLHNMAPATLPDYVRRVMEAIGDKPVIYQGKSIEVHASGGFIPLPFAGLDEQEFDWEKTLQIADLAMYMGKTHGRNCAVGVLDLNVSLEEAGSVLFRDLGEAINNGWVESCTVQGPEPQKAASSSDQV